MIALMFVAALASRFDLVCDGFKSSYSARDVTASAQSGPWSERYSVDLDVGAIRAASATGAWPLDVVTPAQLAFRTIDKPRASERWTIDRISGELKSEVVMGDLHIKRAASCTKAPFTPLPPAAF